MRRRMAHGAPQRHSRIAHQGCWQGSPTTTSLVWAGSQRTAVFRFLCSECQTNGVVIFVRKEIRVPHDTEQNEQS